MGINRSVYVGAYLRITEPVTVTKVDRCADHDRGRSIFCPECGRDGESRFRTEEDAPSDEGFWDHDDWIDHLALVSSDDVLTTRTTIAVSNSTKCDTGFAVNNNGEGVWEVPNRLATMSALRTFHQNDIERLRALGCTVTIQFGILAWSS